MCLNWTIIRGSLIRAVFAHAIDHQPAILFIDEIESLTRTRSTSDTTSTSCIKSTLLIEWGKLEQKKASVIVIGATNLPGLIDTGFLRRMRQKLYVQGPGPAQRKAIFADTLASHTHIIDLGGHNGPNSLQFVFEVTIRSNFYTGCDIIDCVTMAEDRCLSEMICSKCFIEVRYILSIIAASYLLHHWHVAQDGH